MPAVAEGVAGDGTVFGAPPVTLVVVEVFEGDTDEEGTAAAGAGLGFLFIISLIFAGKSLLRALNS